MPSGGVHPITHWLLTDRRSTLRGDGFTSALDHQVVQQGHHVIASEIGSRLINEGCAFVRFSIAPQDVGARFLNGWFGHRPAMAL
jgi:hypothetical protein